MASVLGVSNYPFAKKARVFSAEMTGYMSQRQEMGMGVRYTHELDRSRIVDFSVAGGQNSRGLTVGAGLDMRMINEELYSPRVSVKPFFQHQNFEGERFSTVGAAPTFRKGFTIQGFEFYPYLGIPLGIKIDAEDVFVYHASSTLGTSFNVPGEEKMVISLEANKNWGASSDYIAGLVSWLWN